MWVCRKVAHSQRFPLLAGAGLGCGDMTTLEQQAQGGTRREEEAQSAELAVRFLQREATAPGGGACRGRSLALAA